jgi:MFS family permease
VNEVTDDGALLDRSLELATELRNGPQVAMRLLKRAVYNAAHLTFDQAGEDMRRVQPSAISTRARSTDRPHSARSARDLQPVAPGGVAPTGFRAGFSLLGRNRDFRRLFLASVISLGGDWFLFVAITGLILETTGRAIDVGLAILAQQAAFFLASPFAGVLADRLDRRKLMIGCDLVRVAICAAFLLVGPDTVWLAYPLLAVLSVFSAPFDPASSAAIPNLVDPEDLPTANALSGSLWGTMLAVGAAVGGIVSTVFGRDTAFVINAVSFALSALLLSGIRRPFSEPREDDHDHPKMVAATVEVVHYARRDRRVFSLISVKGGFGLAAGAALIPVFGVDVFHDGVGVGC